MKLLITGGAGFIGSNFVHYWTKNHPDDSIRVLDKLTYAGNLANLNDVKDKIEFVRGDVADPAVVAQAMGRIDTVVHFAAESHVDRSINDPYIFTHTNVLGSHVLLEAARKAGVKRFHHVSTDEVYGDIPLAETWKFTENSVYRPSSPYAASKAASDHLVRAFGRTFNFPYTISNCGNNYGPYQYPEKFFARSIARLLTGKNIRLYSPGNQIRDWLFVRDHCRAIDFVLQKGKLSETYLVGGLAKGISNIDVAKKILALMNLGEDRMELVTDRPGHDVKYEIDWTKIKNELGWEPAHNFDDWLKETIEWYKQNEAWWKPLAQESEQFYQTKGESVISS